MGRSIRTKICQPSIRSADRSLSRSTRSRRTSTRLVGLGVKQRLGGLPFLTIAASLSALSKVHNALALCAQNQPGLAAPWLRAKAFAQGRSLQENLEMAAIAISLRTPFLIRKYAPSLVRIR